MKNYFYCIFILATSFAFSQIGISSNPSFNPSTGTALDVDGNLTIRNKIYAGGNDNTLGNPGKAGQVLVSQGPNLPPRWRTLNLPNLESGFFYLIYNNSFTDYTNNGQNDEGITLSGSIPTGNNGPYSLGALRSQLNGFTTIQGLTKDYVVHSTDNKVYITFEAVAHIVSSNANNSVDFVCGIFTGKKTDLPENRRLQGIRKTSLQLDANPFITFTQIAMSSVAETGEYTAEVACRRTNNYNNFTGSLTIGRAASNNLNNFTTKTSLKVEVYEVPQVLKDIIDFN